MSTNTTQLTDFLLETMKQSKDFVLEKAPIVAQEMLTYGMYQAILETIFGIALIYLVMWLGKRKQKVAEYDDANFGYAIMIIAASILSTVFILEGISIAVKIKVAPSVYLIEKINK